MQKHLSSRNFKAALVLPSNLTSSVTSTFHHHPLIGIAEVAPFSRPNMAQEQLSLDIEAHLSSRSNGPDQAQIVCAKLTSKRAGPNTSFGSTISLWSASLPSKRVEPPWSGLTYSDLTRHPKRGSGTGGPPRPFDQPPWGQQIYNAKLVVNHLKIGHMALGIDAPKIVEDEELLKSMVKIMSDEKIHTNAAILCSKFCYGFPSGSNAAFVIIQIL
ncbi:hypothetical protein ACH5RR_039161 [Cinchona calisaya]|uniref:Uncharacterized protein n=1 Tax=Cinchona calisaya TaxID=153742 RepID=A0ABD2XY00_9GENT